MSVLNIRELQPFVVSDVRVTGRVLGEGSYGSVKEAKMPGATCVVKNIHEVLLPVPTEADGADRMTSTFAEECRLMSTVRHPHIVQFLGVCVLPGSRLPALVMEKLMIDLHSLLEKDSPLNLPMKHSILLDVSKGLTYLHTRRPAIIHRDLSARNVLLNSAMVAKIADLGNSRIINARPSQLMTMTKNPGNMWYMPPEAQDDTSKYNTSIDVFSFGNLTLFTLTQEFPIIKAATYTLPNTGKINARSEIERRSDSFDQVYHGLGRDHPLVLLAEQCLDNLPSKRPPITDILAMLEAFGAIVQDPYNLLNKLEMVQLHKREVALLQSELLHNEQKLQSMQEDYEARLKQMSKKQEHLQQQLCHIQAQLQSNQQPGPTPDIPSRSEELVPSLSAQSEATADLTSRSMSPPLPASAPDNQQQQQQQQQPVSSLPSAATASIIIPRAVIGREQTITIQTRNAKGELHPHGGEDVQATLAPYPEPDWAPDTFLEKVEVVRPFTKEEVDELKLSVGDVVYVTRKSDDEGWFEGVCKGVGGLFHGDYVKKIANCSARSPPVSTEVCDNRDGTYKICFSTQHCGYHQLDVSVEKQPIKGSPFVIYSREARPYTSLSTPLQTFSSGQSYGIAVSENGDLYAASLSDHIRVFNKSGSKRYTIGRRGCADGQFILPNSISLHGNAMFIADTWNHRIQKFTLTGSFITRFGTKGDGRGQLSFPHSVCLDHEGRVFVADEGNSRVCVFSNDGAFLYDFNDSSDNLDSPRGLAFDPSGNLHVADFKLKCVKVFTPRGDYLTEYGKGQLDKARYIAINEEGYSFVTDGALSIFDPHHNCVYRSDKMNTRGVALDKDGYIYVANYNDGEILKV